MVTIRHSRPSDGQRAVQIWRAAVDATHDFLSRDDRIKIDQLVCDFLPEAALVLAVDSVDVPIGFMMLTGSHMEALFIHPDHHGLGIGRALVAHAASLHHSLTTEVNEQNTGAVRFYSRMGFEPVGRSPVDEAGRPYPLLHLQRRCLTLAGIQGHYRAREVRETA